MSNRPGSTSSSPPRPWSSQTRGMEGFYRAAAARRNSHSASTSTTASNLPPRPATMEDRSAGGGHSNSAAAAAARGSLMAPHELGVALTPSHDETTDQTTTNGNETKAVATSAHPATLRARERTMRTLARQRLYNEQQQEKVLREEAEERRRFMEATTATGDSVDDTAKSRHYDAMRRQQLVPPKSLAISLTYQGMSVVMGTTEAPSLYVICARSQFVLQQLNVTRGVVGADGFLPAADGVDNESSDTIRHNNTQSSPIVALKAHAVSGQVVVVHANGMVRSFVPIPIDPTKSCYGRYEWVPWNYTPADGNAIPNEQQTLSPIVLDARQFFSNHDNDDDSTNTNWLVSLSMDYKILLAHGNQLMVLDTTPPPPTTTNNGGAMSPRSMATNNVVVWMSRMPGTIRVAQFSGDAHAIAVVCHDDTEGDVATDTERKNGLDDDDDDDAGKYGVHILERDMEDGSEADWSLSKSSKHRKQSSSRRKIVEHADAATSAASTEPPANKSGNNIHISAGSTPRLSRSRSVGVVYKPGPFLVHSSPVTRLVFRGHGHNTSSAHGSRRQQGNDLLLTYCEDTLSARIFCQNGWNCLIEWDTPVRTRIDWIHGVSAFTLGDLEPRSSSSKHRNSSAPSSRRPSLTTAVAKNETGDGDANSSRRQHYQSIPSHATPYSNAGAWISEITFQNATPAIRLSRLTYLKRGVDKFSPTLFENVSALLPVGLIPPSVLCGHDDSYLIVEGIWPAWNPCQSDASTTSENHTETVQGSAMSFLGLASGPTSSAGAAGGNFSDGLLSNTQTPPCEVRMVIAHPDSGKLLALEFPMMGDRDWTSLELGNPTKSLLRLCDIDRVCGKKRVVDRIPVAATIELASSQLVAEHCDKLPNFISLSWWKHGPSMVLPSHWMPEDVDPEKAAEILSERRWFKDESALPVPLELSGVFLPLDACINNTVLELRWWADDNFEGPPILIVVLSNGTIILLEIAPPWGTEQPVLLQKNAIFPESPIIKVDTVASYIGEIYEVSIIPDSEFGLGLRLEVQQDGNPAIAGSFKRNPISGDELPAEQTGLIALGDELVSANGVNLEAKMFDDIIATVRDIGAISGVGNPMKLTFRRITEPPQPPSPRQRRVVEQTSNSESDLGIGNASHSSDESETDYSIRCYPDHYNIVAIFDGVIKELASRQRNQHDHFCLATIPCKGATEKGGVERSCVLFYSIDSNVFAILMQLYFSPRHDKSLFVSLGAWANDSDNEFPIVAMDAYGLDEERNTLILCDASGVISLLYASLLLEESPRLYFQHFGMFRVSSESLGSILLRQNDVGLIATMQMKDGGICGDEIKVWSMKPDPRSSDTQKDIVVSTDKFCYLSSTIQPDSTAAGSMFSDFAFVKTGYLDSTPTIVAFSMRHVTMYSNQAAEWLPTARMSYKYPPESSLCGEMFLADSVADIRPQSSFAHLTRTLLSAYLSDGEKEYIADWRPEALIAAVVADGKDPLLALAKRSRRIFQWLCTEGIDVPETYAVSRLYTAPLSVCGGLGGRKGGPHRASKKDSHCIMTEQTVDPEDVMADATIRKLHMALAANCALKDPLCAMPPEPLKSLPVITTNELPSVLLALDIEDLHLLRGVCELLLDSPDGDSIDTCGQLFVFAASLVKALHSLTPDICSDELLPSPSFAMSSMSPRSLLPNSVAGTDSRQLPSSACLSALLSGSQSRLLDFCKRSGKLDWVMAKRLKLAFWVRSDIALARLSEEIGQTLFRSERDAMESALYFIVARKTRTLRNLAATDSTENGRKFYSFLSSFDFSSERGRRAAEKNGFSLLRKCKYRAAAAFFLLAEPPFLTAAVETLATKLKDFDLAFLVARLMESDNVAMGSTSVAIGGGGGGGYANFTAPDPLSTTDTSFEIWKPVLKKASRKLLLERVLPVSLDDSTLCATIFVWLGQKDHAAWICSGIVPPDNFSLTRIPTFLTHAHKATAKDKGVALAAKKLSILLGSMSPPVLLKAMRANARSSLAATLTVSNSLERRGLEIASIATILNFGDLNTPYIEQAGNGSLLNAPGHSNVFGSSAIPSRPSSPPASPLPYQNKAHSSIFDSFDVPMLTVKPRIDAQQPSAVQSSIFDSFDVPATRAINTSSASSYQVYPPTHDNIAMPLGVETNSTKETPQSSIFDAFDMPQPAANISCHNELVTTPSKAPIERLPAPGRPVHKLGRSDEYALGESGDRPDMPTIVEMTMPPPLWSKWKVQILVQAAARRLIREIAIAVTPYLGDPPEPPIENFYQSDASLIPSCASGMLQMTCDAKKIYRLVRQSIDRLSNACELPKNYIVEAAFRFLGPPHHQHRTLMTAILHVVVGQEDLAEDIVRIAAHHLTSQCRILAIAYDDLAWQQQTRSHVASQYLRRYSARLSWQLETCLWLHRGGGLPLSGIALKEAIVAVRVGLLVASWNRNYECLEAMVRSDPDCFVDKEAGQQLWASMKSIAIPAGEVVEKNMVSSGGWEFLVDCKRSEATGMLDDKKTGCFIIRPHPGDHGVFTLSFKTNLASTNSESSEMLDDPGAEVSGDDLTDSEAISSSAVISSSSSRKKKSRNNQSVQHAIIRLSESGYRCGSFGPHTTLISLLEAVSASLPFALRFDLPPTNRVIQEEGSQPSPNAVFLRKLALSHADSMMSLAPNANSHSPAIAKTKRKKPYNTLQKHFGEMRPRLPDVIRRSLGVLLELLVLHTTRKQFANVSAAEYEDILSIADIDDDEYECIRSEKDNIWQLLPWRTFLPTNLSQDRLSVAQRILHPILSWCRFLEVLTSQLVGPTWIKRLPPDDNDLKSKPGNSKLTPSSDSARNSDGGDFVLRKMIQRDSGVHFTTLRLVDGGDSTLVVIFSQDEAINWLLANGVDDSAEGALARLKQMEDGRIIESIDLLSLRLKQRVNAPFQEGIRYRILDPWEVEALQNWEGETLGASLGRERFSGFNLGRIGLASEKAFRSLGGVKLLELWTCTRGGVVLTKAIAAIHPVWESCGGGDLQMKNGSISEPPPFENSVRQHLFRNSLFCRLEMPQRFLAIVQIELLDLKNLTAPGLLSMSVYALLRLRREGSTAELTNKSRTLDTAVTHPVKLGKATGPNAPASWGSVVRFRFPLPEDAWVDGSSFDNDREVLFKGPPRMLQVSVYEKKLLVDHSLGTADIRTDELCAGGQLEEWVPLRNDKHGITWFARVRLTLRFELMCLSSVDENSDAATAAPSVGLRKIKELSRLGGGSHEDVRKSVSSPDLVTYFESMVH